MAEVQAQPRPQKQKVGSLDGFLSGQGSSTHAARAEKERGNKIGDNNNKAKQATGTSSKENPSSLALNVCGDVALDALLAAAKKDQLPTTPTTKRTKPRSFGSKDPLRSQSAHGVPRPSALSEKGRSSSSPLERRKSRVGRSQSFNKPRPAEEQEASGDDASPTGDTKLSKQKGVSRSKSFDSEPLKRIPRNPHASTSTPALPHFPRNSSRRGLQSSESGTSMEEKKRRGSSMDRSSAAGAASDHGTLQKQGSRKNLNSSDHGKKQNSQKKLGEKQASQKKMGEKQPSQRKLGEKQISQKKLGEKQSTQKLKRTSSKEKEKEKKAPARQRSKSGTKEKAGKAEEKRQSAKKKEQIQDSQAFSADFGDIAGDSEVLPFEASFDELPAKISHSVPSNLLDESTNREDDDTLGGSSRREPAGIIQFDPTAMDNVKIVRGDSIDEFPSDMGCPVDMGLGDILDEEEEEVGENDNGPSTRREISSRARSHSPTRDIPDADDRRGSRWGNFMNFKLKKSNSFRMSKAQDEAEEEPTTTMTELAMTLGKRLGLQTTGHQQLDDGDSME